MGGRWAEPRGRGQPPGVWVVQVDELRAQAGGLEFGEGGGLWGARAHRVPRVERPACWQAPAPALPFSSTKTHAEPGQELFTRSLCVCLLSGQMTRRSNVRCVSDSSPPTATSPSTRRSTGTRSSPARSAARCSTARTSCWTTRGGTWKVGRRHPQRAGWGPRRRPAASREAVRQCPEMPAACLVAPQARPARSAQGVGVVL